MAMRFASLPYQLLLLFLWLMCSFESRVEAQSETDGYRSTVFDPKYIPYQELLITPKTHAGLFSFTGRWHRRRETYTASIWPGTYLTALIYGDTCILKLRPKPQGPIEDYSFYVSVDGADDYLYTLPPFNSWDKDREIIFVPITIPSTKPGQPKGKTLEPHTVRIISISDYPFSFEGFLVSNTLVRQGQLWTEGQDDRLYVEFIGEGIDAEVYGGLLGWDHDMAKSGGGVGDDGSPHAVKQVRKYAVSVVNATQFRVAETLGIRHAHADTGTCFLSDCDPRDPLPGLSQQYFNENPIPPNLRSEGLRKGTKQAQQLLQQKLQFFAEDPWLRQAIPNAVVVDVGVRDFLRLEEPVSAEKFQRELLVFLGRIRDSARPEATIIVIGRDWENADPSASKSKLKSLVPQTAEAKALRKKLYDVTKYAVAEVHEEDKNVVFASIKPTISPKRDLLDVLCTYVVPVFHPSSAPSSPLSGNKKPEPSKQQSVCINLGNKKHNSKVEETHEDEHMHDHEQEHHGLSSTATTEEHTAPHETAHGSRFIFLYALVLIAFVVGLVFLLSRPFLMILTQLGIVRGNRRVYGVRDTEGGMGLGFGRTGRSRFAKEKNSISVMRSNSGSEEEGFVVLAGGGSQSLGSRKSKGKS
ncbi:hypothetical protein ABW19_dt0204319 [Dactylella cylindrospora]|nr:hypothetical protein ABW19_dt0204319 [Dactylella cylindrospora]